MRRMPRSSFVRTWNVLRFGARGVEMSEKIIVGLVAATLASCATPRGTHHQDSSIPAHATKQAAPEVTPVRLGAGLNAVSIRARLQEGSKVRLAGAVVEGYNFKDGVALVEAVVVRPDREGAMPGLVLIPGYSRTAYDMLPLALQFARAGFATVSVTQPGFGQSSGLSDFAGPRTFAALTAAARRFSAEPYVQASRLGVYGYSRGALAAAQLAARTDLFRAVVLGGGIYDFAAAYRQTTLPGIRANMLEETGMGADAVRFRSPIYDVRGLDGPVLIIHGADDLNAPPEQARALARKLAAAGRVHELILLPRKDHSLAVSDIVPVAVEFLRRHLGANPVVLER